MKKLNHHVDPKEMFKVGPYQGLFSTFDETGLPVLDVAGAEIPKNKLHQMKKHQLQQQQSFDI